MVDAINSLLAALRRAPDTIAKDALNLLGNEGGRFTQEFETWRLIEASEAILDLILGNIEGTPAMTDFMPGSKTVPNKTQHHKSDRAGGSEA